jgi:hypothetical protein
MGPAVSAAALFIRVVGRTWRIERLGAEPIERAVARGDRVLYAFWHARMLPLVFTHRGSGGAVLVSRSRDGELIARVLERLGFVTARGSSTRGGGEGMLAMLEWARLGHLLAITPDGPRGPAERVKSGLAYLSSRSGLPVVPVATASRPALVLGSWDGFRVPLPFARVCVGYGDPLAVPREMDADAEAAWSARLERAIGDLTRTVSARVGEGA